MSKIKNQNIPSDLYNLWKDTNKFPMHTGFNYYDSNYGYIPIHTIGKKPPKIASVANRELGWNLNSIRAFYRFSFQLIGYFWNLTKNIEGVFPPYTGQRPKEWWTNNRPPSWRSNFTYYTKQSMFYLTKKFYAPWQINPNIYISDDGIIQIQKANCNDGTKTKTLGIAGDIPFSFQSVTGISADKNYIFVCDSIDNTIYQFNKNTFAYVDIIDSYAGNTLNFIDLKNVFSDGHYIYICDTRRDYLIKQSITDTNDFLLIPLRKTGEDSTPASWSCFIGANFYYIWDNTNKYILIYNKNTNQFIDRKKFTFSKCFFSVSFYGWWLADYDTKIITLYLEGTFTKITTIGPSADFPFAFNTIDGFCISGDLFLVLDNTSKKLWQINITNFELIAELDIIGRFTDIKQIIAEPQQYFYFD